MARGLTAGAAALGGGASARRSARRASAWPRRAVPAGLLAVAVALWWAGAPKLRPVTALPPAPTAAHALASLPILARGPISSALGNDEPAYRVRGLRAVNPMQRVRARFSPQGITVLAGKGRMSVALSSYGYGKMLRALAPVAPRASSNRVSYSHGSLEEWFANGPLGIEQGFELARRPSAASGPLTLALALAGNLRPRLAHGALMLEGALSLIHI